ncbi:MAG: hypothetical protein LRY43_01545 [Gammaproteobacteria bacterium]|nr:hypothetical protein [Gammaproteobacteria bacterium]MCD8573720.1 hypothetical protein [Gammaproteobacteria bacterium]
MRKVSYSLTSEINQMLAHDNNQLKAESQLDSATGLANKIRQKNITSQ